MKTRCPTCDTRYAIDADALLEAGGLARCFRCGSVFDALAEEVATAAARDAADGHPVLQLDAQAELTAAPPEPVELPFDIPDNLEPLRPAAETPTDVLDTPQADGPWRGFVYGLIALLLTAGLALQLAWQYRELLLERYPQLHPLCERIQCRPAMIRAPDRYSILQRDLRISTSEIDELTLSTTIRNDADFAQPLPDIQLSLLNNDGAVLIRRLLTAREYMFPEPTDGRLIAPDEVVTIKFDFKDPGYLATGFLIDFY